MCFLFAHPKSHDKGQGGDILSICPRCGHPIKLSDPVEVINTFDILLNPTRSFIHKRCVRHSQDKEIPKNGNNVSQAAGQIEHFTTSENSNKTDIAGVDY